MAKQFDMSKYEFAIRETRTAEVIRDITKDNFEISLRYPNDEKPKQQNL